MSLSEWLAQLSAGVVGGAIALAGQAVLRRWRQTDERRRRAEERSEGAAKEIIAVLHEAHDRYWSEREELPRYEDLRDFVKKIRVASVEIIDDQARERTGMIATALSGLSTLVTWGEGWPGEITWVLRHVGEETLGPMLREQPLPPVDERLTRYVDVIEQEWEAYEEDRNQEAAKRSAQVTDG